MDGSSFTSPVNNNTNPFTGVYTIIFSTNPTDKVKFVTHSYDFNYDYLD